MDLLVGYIYRSKSVSTSVSIFKSISISAQAPWWIYFLDPLGGLGALESNIARPRQAAPDGGRRPFRWPSLLGEGAEVLTIYLLSPLTTQK